MSSLPERLAYSIPELARDGAVGKQSQIYEHIAEGRLEAYKLGKRTLVTAESVHALLKSLPRWKPGDIPTELRDYQESLRRAREARQDAAAE